MHKGGLFGSDYRMLFPADGVAGIKRFFVDTLVESGKRGLACQPAIVGVGIGGVEGHLRAARQGSGVPARGRQPQSRSGRGRLEDELTALGNYIGIGAMGFAGTSLVVATHVEIAYTHTGGLPVGIHQFCLSSRRATARIHPDGRVEFRERPGVVHRLLPSRGRRVSAAIERLDDVPMDEVRPDHARERRGHRAPEAR